MADVRVFGFALAGFFAFFSVYFFGTYSVGAFGAFPAFRACAFSVDVRAFGAVFAGAVLGAV